MDETRRSAKLEREIAKWSGRGYRVQSQTPTSAQLVKPKKFSILWALVSFLLFGIGLVVYLIWYVGQRDGIIYITVDPNGRTIVDGRPWTLGRFIGRRLRRA